MRPVILETEPTSPRYGSSAFRRRRSNEGDVEVNRLAHECDRGGPQMHYIFSNPPHKQYKPFFPQVRSNEGNRQNRYFKYNCSPLFNRRLLQSAQQFRGKLLQSEHGR
jgi:hypothetical protein